MAEDKGTAEVRFGEHGQARTLLCPACESAFTHQGRVEVWNRPEDETRPGVAVDEDGALHEVSAEDNPSRRRDGVRIWFVCEVVGCEAQFALTVAQHKGETIIEVETTADVALRNLIWQELASGRFKPDVAEWLIVCGVCRESIEKDRAVVWVVVADERAAACPKCLRRAKLSVAN